MPAKFVLTKLIGCFAILAAMPGCAILGGKPVTDNVVASRQLILRGAEASQRAKWEEAEYLFAEAIEASPVEERAHAMYAEALWRRGERAAAVKHMEESVQLSAGDPTRLVRLGEMYLRLGSLDEAGATASRAIQADRSLASAYALRGDVLTARGRLDDALDRYNEALNMSPHYPRVQMAIAGIYQRQNRPLRALATISMLEERLTPDVASFDLFYLRAVAQVSMGRHRSAANSFRRCAELQPNNPDVLIRMAEAQQAAGEVSAARMAVAEALMLSPNHPQARRLNDTLSRNAMRPTPRF